MAAGLSRSTQTHVRAFGGVCRFRGRRQGGLENRAASCWRRASLYPTPTFGAFPRGSQGVQQPRSCLGGFCRGRGRGGGGGSLEEFESSRFRGRAAANLLVTSSSVLSLSTSPPFRKLVWFYQLRLRQLGALQMWGLRLWVSLPGKVESAMFH